MKAFCQIYAQFDQTGDRINEEAQRLLDLGLVCDTTFKPSQAARNHDALAKIRAAGGLCALNLYPVDADPACADPNWWKYSAEECQRLLCVAREQHAQFGLGPFESVNTYTPGNGFVEACKRLEIPYILGLCAPIISEDGAWQISHYGSPLSPYFVSGEDYRKPVAPGADPRAVMLASMELRNPLICLNHWSEGPWCPLNSQAADRWLEPSADPLPFLQVAEDWIRQSELSGRTLFFSINLQYFFAGRCYEHNHRALEWLAEQRDKGRLEIGSLKTWAARLKSGEATPRQTTYWRGETMGYHVGHRPGCFPDVIVDESTAAEAVYESPEPLPKRFYDYTRPWNYPAFQPDGSAPASSSFAGANAEIAVTNLNDIEREITFTLSSEDPAWKPHCIVWNALEGVEGPFNVSGLPTGWTARIVPHPCGIGAAVLVEGERLASRLSFRVGGSKPATEVLHRTWGHLVAAQTFYQGKRPYTMLAAQTIEPFTLTARIRRDPNDLERLEIESLTGIEYERGEIAGSEAVLRFDGTRLSCWHRIWGVTAGQIDFQGVEEVEARLRRETAATIAAIDPTVTPDAPGFQIFGNIRDPKRWDRALARNAGEAEIRRMNAHFQTSRPGCGEIVIEAHPGIFLPRGSIGKALGHEFDQVTCAPGYAFKETCVDYPQGWDWGVAGWVQWRHLKLQIDGLRGNTRRHFVHLNAFDPEERDVALRIHFFDPKAARQPAPGWAVRHIPELCVVKDWRLPRRVEGRWADAGLCSIPVPEECHAWSALGIWVTPLEKQYMYDWVSERGAPGCFSHLWLSRE